MSLRERIVERIRAQGPLTFAEYMDLALYDPDCGYYARTSQRSGRGGDFFTSVDVGPIFGELLADQIGEMWRLLKRHVPDDGLTLIEVGAGNGRLARDVLEAAATRDPALYRAVRLVLVEASAAARDMHRQVLGRHADRLSQSTQELPERYTGILYANELLDALPAHRVRGTDRGLEELYVGLDGNGALVEQAGPPSTPELGRYFERLGLTLEPGLVAEVSLAARAWLIRAARRLVAGFVLLIDYGHEADELYSPTHGQGTVTTFQRHHAARPGERSAWLDDPGAKDLTLHVDFTTLRRTAEEEGLDVLGLLDQTYFVMGLGIADRLSGPDTDVASLRRRLALKTLMLPGGLGSTHKVLILGRQMGRPALRACSYRTRLT